MKKITKQMVNGDYSVNSIVRTVKGEGFQEFYAEIGGKVHKVKVTQGWPTLIFEDEQRGMVYEHLNNKITDYKTLTDWFYIIDFVEYLFERDGDSGKNIWITKIA